MKRSLFLVLTVLVLGVSLGFNNGDNPNSLTKKFTKTKTPAHRYSAPPITDYSNPNQINIGEYYVDDFNGANDTDALKSRGYLVYKNGTSTGTVSVPAWFQGVDGLFPSFNGPDSGYVAANYQIAGNFGNIDNWLVTPKMNPLTGDSICFYARSINGNIFPDSMRVMYSAAGDSTPDAASWIELGRFLVNPDSAAFAATRGYEYKAFGVPSSGVQARFALRYAVVDGGLFGDNSNYIGIDALRVKGDGALPVELASFVSVISDNDVTLNWSTVNEINNSGFFIERSIVNGQWSMVKFVKGIGNSSIPQNYSFIDKNLNSGNYNYRLKQIDLNGNFEYFNLGHEVVIGVPTRFELSQNYPNPFNPSTNINYQLPKNGNVSVSVFDNSGKEIMKLVNGFKTAGYYTINFNATSLSSGVYFYKISSDNFSSVKKMMLVK